MKETLSDKIKYYEDVVLDDRILENWIDDVKEAVKKLKDRLGKKAIGTSYGDEMIDEVFGDKLTK